MASGYHHDNFTRHLMLPMSVAVSSINYLLAGDLLYCVELGTACYIGLQVGRYVTPDQDQNNKNYFDFLAELFDPYVGKFLFFIFYPYGLIFPHRHFLTHFPVISTIIRLLYLFLMFSPFILALDLQWIFFTHYFLFFSIGVILADINHWLLDYTPMRYLVERIFVR